MADYQRKRRKHRNSSSSRSQSGAHSRSRSHSSSQRSVSSSGKRRMVTPQKKNSILLPFLFLTTAAIAFVYLSQDKKKQSPDSNPIEQKEEKFTVEERIKQKEMSLKLKQDIDSQEAKAEKFKEPVGKIDPLEPETFSSGYGYSFPW